MLRGLFGKSDKQSGSEGTLQVEKLSSALERSILGTVGSKGIPSMPAAAQKAFQLSTDPNAEAQDFIDVIESDESLSARVLKIANSVYFDRGKPSETIEDSVLVIGIDELRCLLNANTLSEIFPSRHPERAQLWMNDVATGLIARKLAQRILPSQESVAFLAGLMHDMGKLLLLQRNTHEYRSVIAKVRETGESFVTVEEELFPFDHTQVGQLIAERWKFSPDLVLALRSHHFTWEEITPPLSLTGIVKTADLCAHSLGLGHPRGFAGFQNLCTSQLQEAWERIGFGASEHRDLLADMKRHFELEYEQYSS